MKLFLKFFSLFFLISKVVFATEIGQKPLIVVSSINPIHQIVLAITEDKANSFLVINPNFSAHDYQLKKSDAKRVSQSDLIFYIDNSLEQNFVRLIINSNAKNKSYSLTKVEGIKLLQRRGLKGKIDAHIWLNPQNSIKIAEFITKKLSEIDVKNTKKYQKNLEKFKQETIKAEKLIRQKLAVLNKLEQGFVFYHDGYQYFEDYFDVRPLKVMSYDHHKDLSIKDLREFNDLVKSGKIKCVFGEKYDEKNSAQKLAKNYNLKFSSIDLIGLEDVKGGYLEILNQAADDIVSCMK